MRMYQTMCKKVCLPLMILLVIALLAPAAHGNGASTPDDNAVQFLKNDYQKNGLKNTEYNGVGCYAFYILNQKGIDTSAWYYKGTKLSDAAAKMISDDITNASGRSAKLLAGDLAAAKALQRNDLADRLLQILKARQTITGFDGSIFYNIPAFDLLGRAGLIQEINHDQARNYILGQQRMEGNDLYSWGFTFGGKYYPDFVTVTKAVRALHYLDPGKQDGEVQAAINRALNWMKDHQQPEGSFWAGYPGMDDPVIDTAEVIMTLRTLGMDPVSWKSSGSKSPVDYLTEHALNPDGSFGKSKNDMDAVWFLDAAVNAQAGMNSGTTAAAIDAFPNAQPAGIPSQPAVVMAVVGEHGELLSGPFNITVKGTGKWGMTILEVLVESGVSSHATQWSWGMCVDAVAGLPTTGGGGWMYAVNDQPATQMSDVCPVHDGDKILWYYAYGMEQPPLPWSEVVKLSAGHPGGVSAELAVADEMAVNAAILDSAGKGQVELQLDSTQNSLQIVKQDLVRVFNTGKSLAIKVQGAQLILPPGSLNSPDLDSMAQLIIGMKALNDWEVQNQIATFTGSLQSAGDIYDFSMAAVNQDNTRKELNQLPGCRITLTVPRGMRDAVAAGQIAAYRYKGAGQWESAGGTYDSAAGTISFEAISLGIYALMGTAPPTQVSL